MIRHVGSLKITFSRNYGDNSQTVISQMGFDVPATKLRVIDALRADAALSRLFSRDLAYGEKVMEADVARRYASDLIAEYAETEAKIFTNADWEDDGLAMDSGYQGDLRRAHSDYERPFCGECFGRRRGLSRAERQLLRNRNFTHRPPEEAIIGARPEHRGTCDDIILAI